MLQAHSCVFIRWGYEKVPSYEVTPDAQKQCQLEWVPSGFISTLLSSGSNVLLLHCTVGKSVSLLAEHSEPSFCVARSLFGFASVGLCLHPSKRLHLQQGSLTDNFVLCLVLRSYPVERRV